MAYVGVVRWKRLIQRLIDKIDKTKYGFVYGVPRGGCLVAIEIARVTDLLLTDAPNTPRDTLIVDDLLDSGATREKYEDFDFEVLINKQTDEEFKGQWIEFWFENTKQDDKDLILRLAQRLNVEV